jgi:hypothetical protein
MTDPSPSDPVQAVAALHDLLVRLRQQYSDAPAALYYLMIGDSGDQILDALNTRTIPPTAASGELTPGTPLPWVTDQLRLSPEEWAEARDEVGQTILCQNDGMVSDVLACVIGRNRQEREERARYIVHACNEYPALKAHITTLETTIARLSEALEAIEFRSTNHGGWFDQPGQQFAEYCKLGDIARQARQPEQPR